MSKTTPNFQESTQHLFRLLDEASGKDASYAGGTSKASRNQKSLEQLRSWLGAERDQRRKGYMNAEAFFKAYLFYYLPLHLPEVFWINEQMNIRMENYSTRSWVDIGCGPGTASISMALSNKFQKKKDPKEIVLMDQSKRALQFAREVLHVICPETKIKTFRVDLRNVVDVRRTLKSAGNKWDAVLISHVLNEFGNGPRLRDTKLELLELFGRTLCHERTKVYVIEPPLKSPTMDLMHLGDDLLEGGATILGPCPRNRRICPMLKDKKGWCYAQPERSEFRQLGLTPKDKRIEKALKIQLTHPGFSYLVYEPGGSHELTTQHRLSVANEQSKTALFCDGDKIVKRPRKEYFRGQWVDVKASDDSNSKF